MRYIVVAVSVSCVTTLMSAKSTRAVKFKQVESLNNKISDHSLIAQYHTVQSELSCARECSNNYHCLSFFYLKNQRFCSLHSKMVIGFDQTTDNEGAEFFKLWKDFTGKGYTFNRTCGSWFKVHSDKVTWTTAETQCDRDGAVLVSPNTKQKKELMEYFRINVIGAFWPIWTSCKGKKGAEQWVWIDGTAIDETNWFPGYPPSNSSGQCTSQYFYTKWVSYPCYYNLPFICEITSQ